MSETTTPAKDTIPVMPTSGGMTTRSQHRREQDDQKDANNDEPGGSDTRKKEKEKPFKGKDDDKLGGNVFQLAEEGRKGNQYTTTMDAIFEYVALEFDYAGDLDPFFDDPCVDVILEEPSDDPPFLADKVTRAPRDHRKYRTWQNECDRYDDRLEALTKNKKRLCALIIRGCSQAVKTKLESTEGYTVARKSNDCKWFITTLKNICHRFEQTENRFCSLADAKAAIFAYTQGAHQTTTDYYEQFKEMLSVLESYGGKLHDPPEAAPASAKIETLSAAEQDAFMRDRYCAAVFLRNADPIRFGTLRVDFKNDFSKGRDEYPTSLVAAYQLLLQISTPTKKPSHSHRHRTDNRRNESGHGTNGGRAPGRSGGRGDNEQPGTPRPGRTGGTFTQIAFSLTQLNFSQVTNHFPDGIPNHLILLDSDSTVSIFCNHHMLTNIRTAPEPLCLEANGGGYQVTTQIGTVPNFGDVWYNPESIANILSLAHVRTLRRVTMDTSTAAEFHVHAPDGSGYTIFGEHISGLYLHDPQATPRKMRTRFSPPRNPSRHHHHIIIRHRLAAKQSIALLPILLRSIPKSKPI